MKELRIIRAKPSDWDDMEALISEYFKREIYLPVLEIMRLKEAVLNAPRRLLEEAILKHRITYEDGMLKGKFSAGISKEIKALGGVWNRRHKAWAINLRDLPVEVMAAVSTQQSRIREIVERIDRYLASIDPEVKVAAKQYRARMDKLFEKSLEKFDLDFDESVKDITLPFQLNKRNRAEIAKQYTENLEIPIKKFTRKATEDLRSKVQEHTYKGLRWEGLIKDIEQSYRIAAHKAKFLARQETHLLLAAYKKARYTGMGISQYKWRCVTGTKQHPVRPIHRKLNNRSLGGELFDFNDPPVTSTTGAKNNPGEDFNCRCVAIPIVKFA